MNGSAAHSAAYLETLIAQVEKYSDRIQSFVIPPFPYLREATKQLSGSSVKLGAQNVGHDQAGLLLGKSLHQC